MCGALDCPSCGPAQGVQLVRVWDPHSRRYRWVPAEDLPEDFDDEPIIDEVDHAA
jgi:hypothetical protein